MENQEPGGQPTQISAHTENSGDRPPDHPRSEYETARGVGVRLLEINAERESNNFGFYLKQDQIPRDIRSHNYYQNQMKSIFRLKMILITQEQLLYVFL